VALLEIQDDSEYSGQAAEKLLDREDDIHLLFIRRGNSIVIKLVFEETLQTGDLVMIFGDKETIKNRFSDILSDKRL
jgi:uncharacterized protein with PhoU and TrkA domain